MSSIINRKVRQSYPSLAWLMFHNISQIYRDIRQQESEEATELIINLRDKFKINSITVSSPRTPNLLIEQPTRPLDQKTVTEDLKEIQPRPSQVWNCDEI